MTFKITHIEKEHLMHVVGESAIDCFPKLWENLEWDFETYNYRGSLPLMRALSQRYIGIDASFDCKTMMLDIGEDELDALNDMLKFAGYDTVEESEYDLDITVK